MKGVKEEHLETAVTEMVDEVGFYPFFLLLVGCIYVHLFKRHSYFRLVKKVFTCQLLAFHKFVLLQMAMLVSILNYSSTYFCFW